MMKYDAVIFDLGNTLVRYYTRDDWPGVLQRAIAELGNLNNLRDLYLHENRLVGTIPKELGNLNDLREMFLRHNQLNGLVPMEVAVVAGSISPDYGCQFVPGNAGLYIPDTPEYRAADIDGNGYICRLGFTP